MFSVGDAKLEKTIPRELRGKRLYGFSLGILGQMLPFSFTGSLIFIYYVYVIGLNPILVSIGTLMGFIIKAIASPISGMIADRKRPDRYGKRRSLLLIALPFFIISFIFLWISSSSTTPEAYNYAIAIQLWVLLSVFYFSFTLLRSTYLSMLPEQSQTEKNRVKISEIQGIFSIVSSLLAMLLPIVLFALVDDPQNIFNTTTNGSLIMRVIPWVAFSFSLISIIITIGTFFSVDETFHIQKKNKNPENRTILSFKNRVNLLFAPLEDKNYVKYLISLFFWNIGLQILLKIMFFLFTYVLELEKIEYLYFGLLVLPIAGIGIFFWMKSIRNRGLKETYINSTFVAIIFLLIALVFLIPMAEISLFILSIFIIGGIIACVIPGFILPNPIISKFIDKRKIKNQDGKLDGKNDHIQNSGSYFGLFLMVVSLGYAFGDLLTGIVFNGNTQNPEIIRVFLPLISFFLVLSLLWIKNTKFE